MARASTGVYAHAPVLTDLIIVTLATIACVETVIAATDLWLRRRVLSPVHWAFNIVVASLLAWWLKEHPSLGLAAAGAASIINHLLVRGKEQ